MTSPDITRQESKTLVAEEENPIDLTLAFATLEKRALAE